LHLIDRLSMARRDHPHRRHHQRLTSVLMVAIVYHRCHHHQHRSVHVSNVTLTVGHSVDFALVFLDQNGNPMLTTPSPDAAPAWSDIAPATGTLVPAASGLTASELAIAAGSDTVSVSLMVAGVSFSASIDVTVEAAPQVLTSVQITGTVS